MSTIETMNPSRTASGRMRNLTLAVAAAMLWAVLHYGVAGQVLSQGINRPLCLLVGNGGVLAALLVLILAAVTSAAVARIDGRRDGAPGVLAVALAIAIWAYPAGTMDDWLKNVNAVVGPPSSGAYVSLIPEYICWAIIFAATFFVGGGLKTPRAKKTTLKDGLTTLLITVVAAALLIMLLSGPRISHTYHGQVYFSVAVGFILAATAAGKVSGVREPLWYLPAPFIVGLIGLLYATAKPGLGVAAYANINVIPANGLVRAMPIETAAVGVAAILFTLHAANRISSDQRDDA